MSGKVSAMCRPAAAHCTSIFFPMDWASMIGRQGRISRPHPTPLYPTPPTPPLASKELASKELGVLGSLLGVPGYSDLLGMQWRPRLFRSIGNAMAFSAIPIYWECNGVPIYLGVPMSGRSDEWKSRCNVPPAGGKVAPPSLYHKWAFHLMGVPEMGTHIRWERHCIRYPKAPGWGGVGWGGVGPMGPEKRDKK